MGLQIVVDGTSVPIVVKQIERGLFEVSGVYQGITVIADDLDYESAIEKWMRAAIQATKQAMFKR